MHHTNLRSGVSCRQIVQRMQCLCNLKSMSISNNSNDAVKCIMIGACGSILNCSKTGMQR